MHSATGLISSDLVYENGKSGHDVLTVNLKRVNNNFAELMQRVSMSSAPRDFRRAKCKCCAASTCAIPVAPS